MAEGSTYTGMSALPFPWMELDARIDGGEQEGNGEDDVVKSVEDTGESSESEVETSESETDSLQDYQDSEEAAVALVLLETVIVVSTTLWKEDLYICNVQERHIVEGSDIEVLWESVWYEPKVS